MTRHFPLALALVCGGALGIGSALAQSRTDKKPDAPSPVKAQVQDAKARVASRIERYAKVLGLDAAQTDAARDLYEAYQKETQSASKKLQESMKDAQDDMNAGDRGEFERRVQKTTGDHRAALKKSTDSFLSDLKSLLRADQQDNWPAFERYRRREKYLNAMMGIGGLGVGGSSVDLFPVIEKLGVPADAKAKVDEAMSRYEMDIDHPLQERERNTEDEQREMGAVQKFSIDSFNKKQERDRKVDLAIREVNTRYVREIAALLPEELAKKLNEAYQTRAYRSIYKESAVGRKLAAAQQIKDLSADQRDRLRALADQYRRDARAANDRWAAAQEKAETAGRPTGAGLMMIGPGDSGADRVDPDLAAARAGKRELDSGVRDQLGKILTPEQLADLPDSPSRGGVVGKRVAVIGDHTGENMVFVDDIDLGDDVPPEGAGGGAPTVIIRTVEGQRHRPAEGGDEPRPAPRP